MFSLTPFLDVSLHNDTLLTIALVVFILAVILWIFGWGLGHWHRP